MGRHDSGYKLLFSHPYLVECLIRTFVPGDWTRHLDFESLETVSEAHARDIGVRYDDMIWRLRWRDSGRWVYFYLMLEFQSTDEPFMSVRILDYDGGLYRKIVRELELRRGDRLPVVLPVVFYRGQPAWSSATEVFDLIEPAPAEVVPYLPHLRFLLLDVNAYEPEQLACLRDPVACLLRLESSRDLETGPIEDLDRLLPADRHGELRRAFVLWLTQEFLPTRLLDVTVPEVKKLEEVSPRSQSTLSTGRPSGGRKAERKAGGRAGRPARQLSCCISSVANLAFWTSRSKNESATRTRNSSSSGANGS